MNSARLTIGLLVLAAVLAVAVPTIREAIVTEARSLRRHPPLSLDEARAVVKRGGSNAPR